MILKKGGDFLDTKSFRQKKADIKIYRLLKYARLDSNQWPTA